MEDREKEFINHRVTLVVEYLGWVDLNLGSSLDWWAAIVATPCPSRLVANAKSKSTQPRYSTARVTLYMSTVQLSVLISLGSKLCSKRQPGKVLLGK